MSGTYERACKCANWHGFNVPDPACPTCKGTGRVKVRKKGKRK